ncbi:RNA-directed DNA polymerase, eukaryota [Tanacetum coccineum]
MIEIRNAVWACGENKSPGPDGFTFEFFHLIPKFLDPKFVSDYRPISLIGCLYKVVSKILAIRISLVLDNLILEVQTAFLPNRQILDESFIINELLSWCKHKKQQAMIFKVDFAKAYDSIRWDFLDDVLHSFRFGFKWRSWILGSLSSGRASIFVNGSPTSEFQFSCGLKQGDPLAPYLFILVMESLHLSFSRVFDAGIFKGLKINNSTTVSHLFYADDAVFVGEWVEDKRKKSHLLGVGIPNDSIAIAASTLGCSVMKTPFKYLGVMVGGNMSNIKVWDDIIRKLNSRLSKWKVKSLSIGGRLMLLKSVLGSTPIYWMSLYKVPKSVLASMEAIRRKFFNGAQDNEKKVTWIKWSKVLSAKKQGGLGVSSFYALNGGLLFKWVWRISLSVSSSSWNAIVREVHVLKSRGVDLLSHCKKRVGNGMRTSFWCDVWIGDQQLNCLFPRIFALEEDKDCSVAAKLQGFSRSVTYKIEFDSSRLSCSFLLCLYVPVFLPEDIAISCLAIPWLRCLPVLLVGRLGSNLKAMLEGVFYVSWWCIWNYRNQLLFAAHKPRKDVIFDDIVARSFTWCNARSQYKLEIYIDHIGVDFVISKYIFPNASLAEMMNHVITDYSSENEGIIRKETQNDYTFDKMVEWTEQEHFEYEETKTSHTISPISTMLSSTIESCLSYTHFFSPLTYYMAYGANEARQAIVLKLQREIQAEETLADQLSCNLARYTEETQALDEEAILEEQMLALMHRFADRFTDRRVEINNLMCYAMAVNEKLLLYYVHQFLRENNLVQTLRRGDHGEALGILFEEGNTFRHVYHGILGYNVQSCCTAGLDNLPERSDSEKRRMFATITDPVEFYHY